jgi:predicted dehydrogenase
MEGVMVWLIGSGPMSIEYYAVIQALGEPVTVVGRSKKSALVFEEKTGCSVVTGGVEAFLEGKPQLPKAAIVSVSVEQLAPVTRKLIDFGVERVLVEKPAGLDVAEISSLAAYASSQNAEVFVAYNRRQYESVQYAKKCIEEDGGVKSFNFEITEWSHVIENHDKDIRTMNSWFLANTSHVVDTAFYVGGEPKEMSVFHAGGVSWHPASSVFSGAGVSDKGALFSYNGNWQAPGRWSVEFLTAKRRYILCPMEGLKVQLLGSVKVEEVELPETVAAGFKPGVYCQVDKFLKGECSELCTLEDQVRLAQFYEKMAGY